MAITNSNKNKASFFYVSLPIILNDRQVENTLSEKMDLVLGSLGCQDEIYRFKINESNKLVYLFSTKTRKRKGQVTKLLARHLSESKTMVVALMKREFYKYINKFLNKTNIQKLEEPNLEHEFDGYSGADINILNDRKNWFPWQEEMYNMMFYKNNIMKECPQYNSKLSRQILFLYDKTGCTGKSTFWKWLFFNHSKDIAVLTIGTASQLRSAVSQCAHKNLYICDLPRAIGRQDSSRIDDLIQTIEELKNGMFVSVMYGRNNVTIMNKPYIVISSNFIIDGSVLSKDRWKILEITEDKKLVDITKKVGKKVVYKVKKLNGVGLKTE